MGNELGRGAEAANRSVGGEAREFWRPRRRMTTGPALTRMMRKGCGLTGGFGNRVNDVIRDVYEIVVDYVVSCIM